MKVAILTPSDNRSPGILADTLHHQLQKQGIETEILYGLDFMTRMVPLKDSGLSFHFWLIEKLRYLSKDRALFKALQIFDAIIISECSPAVFLKRLYHVEKLKKKLKKPVGLYEVYYLGNAPTQIQFLQRTNNAMLERFDFHLSVSEVTEIKQLTGNNWFSIGIEGSSWGLSPLPKKELIAIVDFVHGGNEEYRNAQIRSLKKAGIKYLSLEREYTIKEIRNIYQQASLYFMQSSEAFGLPILECLCCGCQVFTPESWWPMSWRLNENPQVHEDGDLPGCFTVYHDEEQLLNELLMFKEKFDPVESPKKTFETFLKHYPAFYFGNESEIKGALEKIQSQVKGNE